MIDRTSSQYPLRLQLKCFIVDSLGLRHTDPHSIADHEPLLGGPLGLDSLDVQELSLSLAAEFGLEVGSPAEMNTVFASVARLADFIETVRDQHLQQRLSA